VTGDFFNIFTLCPAGFDFVLMAIHIMQKVKSTSNHYWI